MVDSQKDSFCAEVYKCYLYCAGRIITSESGAITAYDGDRVMAVFIGGAKNTQAVRTAMKINFVRYKVINPAIKAQYPQSSFSIDHAIGIDTSKLLVARTGVRGANDLVWVGRAANHAAKLSDLNANYTWITKAVFDTMHQEVKLSNGQSMWEIMTWTAMGGLAIYRSSWYWPVP
jgi:class 3 adenylate cyclase